MAFFAERSVKWTRHAPVCLRGMANFWAVRCFGFSERGRSFLFNDSKKVVFPFGAIKRRQYFTGARCRWVLSAGAQKEETPIPKSANSMGFVFSRENRSPHSVRFDLILFYLCFYGLFKSIQLSPFARRRRRWLIEFPVWVGLGVRCFTVCCRPWVFLPRIP